MDEQSVDRIIHATHWPRIMAAIALGVLALFLLVATAGAIKSYTYIGSGVTATNIISVTGEGEVFAVPDTATFSYSVIETAPDVQAAQDASTKKTNDIIAYLKQQGIDEKDIQTADYSVNPQYIYENKACSQNGYCPPGKQVISGYEVSQTVSVKVRDTKKAGTLLAGVGSKGASNISGLSFTIADEDALEASARDKAIAQARDKAHALAKSLGVSVVRVVAFSEDRGGAVYYAKMTESRGAADATGAPAPDLPAGQNKITSNVSITYEIK